MAELILKDGTQFEGKSFGAHTSAAGEVVFSTGMVGYPESLTDPSYKGQILVLTYPIIGSYGVPEKNLWESDGIKVSGLVVSNYIDTPSHFQSMMTLAEWFKKENVPLIEVKDTRALAQKLRHAGTMLGKIVIDEDIPFSDPNEENLVAQVSTKSIQIFSPTHEEASAGASLKLAPKHFEADFKSAPARKGDLHKKTIVLIDCGAKNNIIRCFTKRGIKVIRVPWDTDVFLNNFKQTFDAVFISNGPGDPKMAQKTIATIKKSLEMKIPTMGICLGNQLLALAAGGDTYKLKFGHRSQNQPCLLSDSDRCYITTQNHGFAIGEIPTGFKPWFVNANDKTVEGIIHEKLPFMAVQFHPEATPGPTDTEWIFDYFIERIKNYESRIK
jgi:carbamoyl-phosphate synthase small subunit